MLLAQEPAPDDLPNSFWKLCWFCFSCVIMIPLFSVFAWGSRGCEQHMLFGIVWKAWPFASHTAQPEQLSLPGTGSCPCAASCVLSWHCCVWPGCRTCLSSAQSRQCPGCCQWFVGWSLKERGASGPICVTATCIWPLRIAFWKAHIHKFNFSSQEGQLLCNWRAGRGKKSWEQSLHVVFSRMSVGPL